MSVSSERGAKLGKAQGYESGYWWGSITGALGAIISFGTTVVVTEAATIITAPIVVGAVSVGGIGYLLGGFYGAKRGFNHCEQKGKELAVLNKTEVEIIDICKSDSIIQGILGGAVAGLAVGALPVIIAHSLCSLKEPSPIDVSGDVHHNVSHDIFNVD
jgi:hypothetical protein